MRFPSGVPLRPEVGQVGIRNAIDIRRAIARLGVAGPGRRRLREARGGRASGSAAPLPQMIENPPAREVQHPRPERTDLGIVPVLRQRFSRGAAETTETAANRWRSRRPAEPRRNSPFGDDPTRGEKAFLPESGSAASRDRNRREGCLGFNLLALSLLLGSLGAGADQFVRVANPGWTNTIQHSWAPAWGDYDRDGFLDILVPNSTASGGAWTNFLYRNNRDGTFTRRTAAEVGPIASDNAPSLGGLWADANNDGVLDLLVINGIATPDASSVASQIYVGQADGTFTSPPAGALTRRYYSYGFGNWCDYDNDGILDAFINAAWSASNHRTNLLFHGRGDGSWDLATDAAVATDRIPSGYSNNSTWADLDNDGDPDLLVSNLPENSPPNQLHDFFYRNEGHGQFVRMTNSVLEEPGNASGHYAVGDFDNDGDLDLAAGGSHPKIFLNNGNGTFAPAQSWDTFRIPVASGDYDNDGYLDLMFGTEISPGTYRERLFHNRGDGTFEQAEESFTQTAAAAGAGPFADYDNDGFLDLLLALGDGQNALFHNVGNANHWLKFRLQGIAANRSAIGAKVRVKATIAGKTFWQMREIASSLMAEDGLRAHFGLGDATKAEEVRVEWPSGNVTVLTDLTANQIVDVTEAPGISPSQPVATINGSVRLVRSLLGRSHQWYFEGAALAAQTNRTLTLTNLQPSQAGRYTDVVQTDPSPQTNSVYLRVATQFTSVREGDLVTNSLGSISATWFDYDNDGYLDLFVANSRPTTDPAVPDILYHNERNGTLARVTNSIFETRRGASFYGAPGDYDNDGNTDLATNYEQGSETDQLFRNVGDGSFAPVAGLPFDQAAVWSISGGWADYNLDGHLDFFATRGYTPNWLKVTLKGTTSNRSGIGAKVRMQATIGGRTFWQMREISGNGGPSAGQVLVAHFGLGDATRATTVHVDWPSGVTQEVALVAADQALTLVEPALWKLSVRMEPDGWSWASQV